MTLTRFIERAVFDGEVKLNTAQLIPGAAPSARLLWFRNFFQSEYDAIEVLCCFLHGLRHSDVDVIEFCDFNGHKVKPAPYQLPNLKFGFSIIPKLFPKGSFTEA